MHRWEGTKYCNRSQIRQDNAIEIKLDKLKFWIIIVIMTFALKDTLLQMPFFLDTSFAEHKKLFVRGKLQKWLGEKPLKLILKDWK